MIDPKKKKEIDKITDIGLNVILHIKNGVVDLIEIGGPNPSGKGEVINKFIPTITEEPPSSHTHKR